MDNKDDLFKKKEIETNPYSFVVDFTDIFQDLDEKNTVVINLNIQNMLLRHNSDLK